MSRSNGDGLQRPHEPLKPTVKGRGQLTAGAHSDADGVTLRLDDDRNPEFWAEVRLTEADLERLMSQVRAAQGGAR